jgi:hypothetical protein
MEKAEWKFFGSWCTVTKGGTDKQSGQGMCGGDTKASSTDLWHKRRLFFLNIE